MTLKNGRDDWLSRLGYILLILASFIILGDRCAYAVIGWVTAMGDDPALSYIESLPLEKNILLLGILLPFALALATLAAVMNYGHHRPLACLIREDGGRPAWQYLWIGIGCWIIVSMVIESAQYVLHPAAYSWKFQSYPFLILFLTAVVGISLQSGFEELFFRGYLWKTLEGISSQRWVPLGITSLVFCGFHYFNPEAMAYGWPALLVYLLMGFFLGYLRMRSGGLEESIGVHLGNNLFAALIVQYENSALATDAIYYHTGDINMRYYLILLIVGILLYMVLSNLFGRR